MNMKKYFTFGLVMSLVFSIGLVVAKKPDSIIPSHAKEVAPGLYYLGVSNSHGKWVQGYAIVHYKKGFGKPGVVCGNGVCEPGENVNKCPADCGGSADEGSDCYGFLSRGAKWKTVEPYVMNPSNIHNLSPSFLTSNMDFNIEKWEDAAGVDILGLGSSTNQVLEADMDSPDDMNEVYFGSISDAGAIAVTVVWGVFYGPPGRRELVEWDQIYDQFDYAWSDSGEQGMMDFENIATHELGHSVGMGDLYDFGCSEQTMYGYAGYGETNKRTLEAGDITGISSLYS
jgi:hypothetical protein